MTASDASGGTGGKRVQRFEKGAFLTRQGEESRDLFIIQFGQVRIFKEEGGCEIDLDTIQAGGVIGEVAAIDGGRRSSSAIALETTEAIVIDNAAFKAVFDHVPDWFRKIAVILVQRLREVDAKIHSALTSSHVANVAAVIWLVSHTPACLQHEGEAVIDYRILQNEIADLLRMQISDVDDAITQLSTQEILAVRQGKVTIRDSAALETISREILEST